jgi:hypothetical protein
VTTGGNHHFTLNTGGRESESGTSYFCLGKHQRKEQNDNHSILNPMDSSWHTLHHAYVLPPVPMSDSFPTNATALQVLNSLKPKLRSSWDRKLWGVKMSTKGQSPILIGEAWDEIRPMQYEGQPFRALLFTTRRRARAWCKAEQAKYAKRENCCADWRFVPVRVREPVTPI